MLPPDSTFDVKSVFIPHPILAAGSIRNALSSAIDPK
jgi:hypothetical protein